MVIWWVDGIWVFEVVYVKGEDVKGVGSRLVGASPDTLCSFKTAGPVCVLFFSEAIALLEGLVISSFGDLRQVWWAVRCSAQYVIRQGLQRREHS